MNQYFPFQVQPLPYSYISLMPYCNADALYFHHDQYYAGAIRQLNSLAVRHQLTTLSLTELLTQDLNLPTAQENNVKNSAGAVYNHELFFDGTTCAASRPPVSRLTEQLIATYGSMQRFLRLLTEAAESLHGSGWVWLISESGGGLHIAVTSDNLTVDLLSVQPIFVIDLWEHTYFMNNQFDVAEYVSAWFSLLDWEKAECRYMTAVLAGQPRPALASPPA